jgi:predicted PhzF superfamily epimerase YddE/YHI9
LLTTRRFLGASDNSYETKRPSLIHLAAPDEGEAVYVEVGGSVVPVACGESL